jgi:hypothetical protein
MEEERRIEGVREEGDGKEEGNGIRGAIFLTHLANNVNSPPLKS